MYKYVYISYDDIKVIVEKSDIEKSLFFLVIIDVLLCVDYEFEICFRGTALEIRLFIHFLNRFPIV